MDNATPNPLPPLYLDPLPPADLMAAVGKILAFWQTIEAMFETSIWGLASLNEERGRALTAHMTFPLRCDALRALYHDHFKDTAADKFLNKLIEKKLKPAQTLRAKYAHALWLKDDDGRRYIMQKDDRAKPYVRPELVTAEMIFADAVTIRLAAELWMSFFLGEGETGPLTERQPAPDLPALQDARFSAALYLSPAIPKKHQRPPQS